jgi:hypothetical protein
MMSYLMVTSTTSKEWYCTLGRRSYQGLLIILNSKIQIIMNTVSITIYWDYDERKGDHVEEVTL